MFDLSVGKYPVPGDLDTLFARSFEDIASPGGGWDGAERVAIAAIARSGEQPADIGILPEAAIDAAVLIATAPMDVTEPWVSDTVSELGAIRYVEIIGIVATIDAIDRMVTLLGFDIVPVPHPYPGDVHPPDRDPRLKQRSAWVPMSGPPKPMYALSASPGAQAMVTRLTERLYSSAAGTDRGGAMGGLTAEQREIVALKVSHSNECFW